MTVSEKDVERVAELANLELTPGEKSQMLHDLNSILEYVAQLNELDTASVPPMAQVAEHLGERKGGTLEELRPDIVTPCLSRNQVLASAPETDHVFFKVPKVIER
jgi:aspartyl-tRNA(Asn)/glutamyl-tRNA(Gln) amidotransferase subunit C